MTYRLGERQMPKSNPLPSFEEVNAHLRYDPDTGFLWWKAQGGAKRTDKPAGAMQNGYVIVQINNVKRYAHRLAWLLGTNQSPGDFQIDHINGIRSDNRLANLRLATHTQNRRNTRKPKNNTSGYKGAYWLKDSQRWQARHEVNGKSIFLGYYKTAFEAHLAYRSAIAQTHGEFARLE